MLGGFFRVEVIKDAFEEVCDASLILVSSRADTKSSSDAKYSMGYLPSRAKVAELFNRVSSGEMPLSKSHCYRAPPMQTRFRANAESPDNHQASLRACDDGGQ